VIATQVVPHGRTDMRNLTAFCNFTKAPKNNQVLGLTHELALKQCYWFPTLEMKVRHLQCFSSPNFTIFCRVPWDVTYLITQTWAINNHLQSLCLSRKIFHLTFQITNFISINWRIQFLSQTKHPVPFYKDLKKNTVQRMHHSFLTVTSHNQLQCAASIQRFSLFKLVLMTIHIKFIVTTVLYWIGKSDISLPFPQKPATMS